MSKRMPSRRGCPDIGVDVEEENGQMGAWLVFFWDSAAQHHFQLQNATPPPCLSTCAGYRYAYKRIRHIRHAYTYRCRNAWTSMRAEAPRRSHWLRFSVRSSDSLPSVAAARKARRSSLEGLVLLASMVWRPASSCWIKEVEAILSGKKEKDSGAREREAAGGRVAVPQFQNRFPERRWECHRGQVQAEVAQPLIAMGAH